jgi:energy-coupling factor transport system ATP-binding protein
MTGATVRREGGAVRGVAVRASAWGYTYPGRSQPALAEVTLSIAPGELVVLMGPSGSGKSTLLGALAGTLPEGGRTGLLEVAGTVVPVEGGSTAAGSVAPVRIGLVQQEPEANVVMERVGDDVAFPLENAAVDVERIWPRVSAVLGAVGLDVDLDRPTSQLSGGQQQLVAVAAAAVADPGLLLLDEPTANLDSGAAADVLTAVEHVRRSTGCTVVVVEHRVEPWLDRADRVLIVEAGLVTSLIPGQVVPFLAARPDLAGRVWVDHRNLPDASPARSPGQVVLRACGVAVAGRLLPIDLVAHSGEIVALTGPPGAGKSTLLAVLAGLLEPTWGTVEVLPGEGGATRRDPWLWPSSDVAGTFGVVFQNPEHQFLTGRVDDELSHGLTRAGQGHERVADRVREMLERLHLAELAAVNPFTLSGGQQRRLSVGTALVLDPRILLLDEPTFGQDPATWAEMVAIVAAHRDLGGAVVLATHDPHLVDALGAREVRLGPQRVAHGEDEARPGRGAVPAAGPAAGRDLLRSAEPGGQDLAVRTSGGAGSPPPGRGLRALDPLALLGSAMLLSMAALLSGSVAVNLGLALLSVTVAILGGLPGRRVVLLALPALVACASVGLSNALLGDAGLTSSQAWWAAALPASRVLAVALPGLVAAVAVDPTSLADALVVRLRVPARSAYSVLAGLRLLPLLRQEWTILALASRARGLGGSGVRGKVRHVASATLRLLVAALRRGGRLAVALDARGLRPDAPRTVARPLRWRWVDGAALLMGGLLLVLVVGSRVG